MVRRESGNLVPNGRFDIVPPFTAATTANDRVVDGTAGGAHTDKYPSATKQLYRWKMNTYNTTSPSVQYEDGALKVSGIACKERVNLTLAKRIYTDLNEADDIRYNLIPVTPSTSYTVSVRVKTEVANAVGTPGVYGAMFRLVGHSGTIATEMIRGITSATDNDKIAVTTDWTTYTRTFTTGASTMYINIDFGIYGDSSNYADITAWFDDIVLQKTAVAPRTTATSRTTATNRVAVRDMGTALYNGYVTANALDISVQPTTVSYWLRYKSALGHNDFAFFTSTATDSLRLNIEVGTGKLFTWKVRADGTGTLGYKTTKRLNAKEWYHVAFTYDPTTGVTEIYIDGVKDGSGGDTTYLCRATNNFQCYMQTNGASTKDDLRVWNRALTATEIQNLYLHGAVPRNGLVGEYLFDEASGTTAIDSSGNGNDGTITGATYTTDTPLRPRTSV